VLVRCSVHDIVCGQVQRSFNIFKVESRPRRSVGRRGVMPQVTRRSLIADVQRRARATIVGGDRVMRMMVRVGAKFCRQIWLIMMSQVSV